MGEELIAFNGIALQFREAINIAITIFLPVLAALFLRIVYIVWQETKHSYRGVDKTTKGLIGLAVMCVGESFRSATVWEVLHNKGGAGTYLTDVVPLIISLILVTVGALCAIRNFTPSTVWWGGHRLWLVCLGVFAIACVINWA